MSRCPDCPFNDDIDADTIVSFTERAAIMEKDGGLDQGETEREACRIIRGLPEAPEPHLTSPSDCPLVAAERR